MSFFRAFLLVLTITALYTPVSVTAQRSGENEEARQTRAHIARGNAERRAQAQAWVLQHRVPRRVRQSDLSTVELVGVTLRRPLYYTSLNAKAARVTHTNSLFTEGSLGLGLSGRGMTLGIWDEGHPLTTHIEFGDRVLPGDDAEVSFHSTHVAGTLAASGIRSDVRGMASEARLSAFDWNNDATEVSDASVDGLLVSNHSYGAIAGWYFGDLEGTGDLWYWLGDPLLSRTEDYAFGFYGFEALQFDRATYANPYLLPVVAAGNDRVDRGPTSGTFRGLDAAGNWQTFTVDAGIPRDGGDDGFDTIAGLAVAKNVLTVGSIGDEAVPRISSFSSFGPIDDGRIKPDVVGYGESLVSTTSTGNASYGSSSGTSMATPNVAGTLLLLQEYHQRLYGRPMRAASLKGLVIHTARDLGNPGPDYRYGWGLVDAEAAAQQISRTQRSTSALLEETLQPGSDHTTYVRVSVKGPLRVTLSWTDAAGNVPGRASVDDATGQLRTDLDLRLVHEPSGREYLPFVLRASTPGANAHQANNTADPVEQVYVAAAEPGQYRLVVRAKQPSTRAQTFSLLTSGFDEQQAMAAFGTPAAEAHIGEVSLSWTTLFEKETSTFRVERAPITNDRGIRKVGPALQIATISATGPSEGEQQYVYRDRAVLAGDFRYRVVYDGATDVRVIAEIDVSVPAPEQLAVLSNYPNPFRGRTTLVVDLPDRRDVRIDIADALGRTVTTLVDDNLAAGRHEIPIDAQAWPAGIYFARVTTRQGIATNRMILVH